MNQYVIAECRPCTDQDEYADICIGDNTYIFDSVEPTENLQAAMLIASDIDRTQPDHTYIVLHLQSLNALMNGFLGQEVSQ